MPDFKSTDENLLPLLQILAEWAGPQPAHAELILDERVNRVGRAVLDLLVSHHAIATHHEHVPTVRHP